MPSPFPGMDPYLEDPGYWSGFHTRFVVALGARLMHELPAGYYAEVEHHVWLRADGIDDRIPFAVPDAFVATTGGTPGRGEGTGSASTLALVEVTLPKPARRKGPKYVAIHDKKGNRVVTVVEVLSPSNKQRGEDRDDYLAKRAAYLESGTNLVEIDLLRDGERLPFGRPKPPPADYYALVSRADRFPKASVCAWTVRDPLPVLPVPLEPADGEIPLDLRWALDRAYEDAGYESRLDYTAPPVESLRALDAAWAADLLKKHAKKRKH